MIRENEIDYEDEREGIERRACETKRNFVYKLTKVLEEKKIGNSKKNFFRKFKKEYGYITEDQDKILTEI